MSELKFTREDNKQYNTVSINIENALIQIKEEDYNITNTEKTKFGYRKATLRLINQDLITKLKSWETEINEYLKSEGIEPITIYTVIRFILNFRFCLQKRKNTILRLKVYGLMIKINPLYSYGMYAI